MIPVQSLVSLLCLLSLLRVVRTGGVDNIVVSDASLACEAVHSHRGQALLDWLNLHGKPQAASPVLVISFTTMDIVDSYAKYALATNYLWAREWGYGFHVFHERIDADPRWNKVKLITEVFDGSRPEYSNVTSVVWVDADLSVVQFTLSIESLLASHPHADIILSRDKATAPFVGNTGFLLAHKSNWTLAFLRRWWSYDRARCCDQHALTWMYDDASDVDRSRLLLLPANDLNTDFPAWLTFDSSSRVLHLAGLPTFYRVTVFSLAFSSLCPPSQPAHQLGITREVLQQAVCALRMQRGHTLRHVHSLFLSPSSSSSSYSLAFLQQLRQQVLDIMKTDNDELIVPCAALATDDDLSALLSAAMQDIYRAFAPMLSSALSHPWEGNQTVLNLLIDASSAGIEMALAQLHATRTVSMEDMLSLDELLQQAIAKGDHLPRDLHGRLLYYRFKIAQIHTEACDDRACRLQWLHVGERLWRDMEQQTGYHGTDYASAEPMKEFTELLVEKGSLLCLEGSFQAGLANLRESVAWQAEVVASLDRLRIATTDIMALARQRYVDVLYNAGLCSVERLEREGGAVEEAREWLRRCSEEADRLGEKERREVHGRLQALRERLAVLLTLPSSMSTVSSLLQGDLRTCSEDCLSTTVHRGVIQGKTKKFRRRERSP